MVITDPDCYQAHETEFKVISRIAKDFLAIPGASVSVERLFSSSRHTCADTRCSLKAETITELMCVKEWIREGLLEMLPSMKKKFFAS
ncbi:hypothetical protein CERSUDRAFT_54364 [Gelatoporia subvermispora B]|uniref:HAT C-terminal dimerisation domain-containing protein n=1 Tax=Ceriporiopsis subvermispora (strain B) TaxID=914234 RepID=M2R9H4_CERS8|nr:hypothetical protein CERSUDRAFT_54364 [Gelatoporia subvermispora B]